MEENLLRISFDYQKEQTEEKLQEIVEIVQKLPLEEIFSNITKSKKVLDFLSALFLGKSFKITLGLNKSQDNQKKKNSVLAKIIEFIQLQKFDTTTSNHLLNFLVEQFDYLSESALLGLAEFSILQIKNNQEKGTQILSIWPKLMSCFSNEKKITLTTKEGSITRTNKEIKHDLIKKICEFDWKEKEVSNFISTLKETKFSEDEMFLIVNKCLK